MAMLIASPLCCCATLLVDATSLSCCTVNAADGSGQPDHHEACACKTKEPRDAAKFSKISENPPVPLEAPTELPIVAPRPIGTISLVFPPHTGCDPPRALLALYSRWLI